MRPRNSQIGGSQESKLLHQVLEQFSELTNIIGALAPTTTTTTTILPLAWIDPCPRVANFTAGVYSSVQINQLTGGIPPYTYFFIGAIPTGLSWNSSTCTLSGTPLAPNTYTNRGINAADSGTGGLSCGLTIIVS